MITSPALDVTAADRITVDGEPLPARERTRLFLFHKPRGLMTTHADPQGRPTIFHKLPRHLPRLISVGRLDFNTEGLLLLTNDGALARLLELPSTGWLRRYRVRAHGTITQDKLDSLRQGVTISGIHYGPIEATLDRVQGTNVWLTLGIREGKNREVRNVLGHLGLTVSRLIRLSFGPFQLGELADGAIEEVRTRVLREQLGDKLVRLSGADFSASASEPASRSGARTSRGPDRGNNQQSAERQSQPRDKKRNSPDHVWRTAEQDRPARKLRRKFHGGRRDLQKNPQPEQQAHKQVMTDRKGRPVVIERRAATPPTDAAPQHERGNRPGPRRHRHGHRHRRPDRSSRGPR